MAYGGVNIPNVSGPDFEKVREKTADTYAAERVLAFGDIQDKRELRAHQALMDAEVLGESQSVTLTNNQSAPFNSTLQSPVTVALQKTRTNLLYTVETEVTAHAGTVGEIEISDKALNGFKIAFTGSGTSVTLTVRVKGGIA